MHRPMRVLLLVVLVCAAVSVGIATNATAQTDSALPAYFIAIHCEPYPLPAIPENYTILQDMVAYADDYNMKLTIMLTAQWSDYIVADPDRLAEVQGWMVNGHEIAAHHHSINHGSWDGYTDFPQEAVDATKFSYDQYLGSLADYTAALQRINPDIQSGCVNDEQNKQAMPDAIIYDTCSGFTNSGEPGERTNDYDAEKGINEFVTVGAVNGIMRKWLTHSQVYQNPSEVIAMVDSLEGGVYGVVTHAVRGQDVSLYRFMDYLHERDPEGVLSRTVATAIEEQRIPEIELADEIVNMEYIDENPRRENESPCGNGVCDAKERENPNLCPQDCE